MSKVIAIIPARGGSKRIPRKNIKKFQGVPMIERTILMAKQSQLFDEIIVSTDDAEIRAIGESLQISVHKRSQALADDFATTVEVISNIVSENLIRNLSKGTVVVCLYPVTPLLRYQRIREAIENLKNSDATYVFAVHEFDSSVERGFKLSSENCPKIYLNKYLAARSQDIEPTYHDAGQFYVADIETWRAMKPIISNSSKVIKLEKFETIDVDNQADWNFAEEIYLLREAKKFPV